MNEENTLTVEIDITTMDVIRFNDEEWQVVKYHSHDNSFDMQSTTGRLENFTRKEIEKNIELTGKFSRVKKSYIGIS